MTRRRLLAMCMFFAVAMPWLVWAQSHSAPTATANFQAFDVHIDFPDHPLAAYQVEITFQHPDARITGVEGGEHPAFQSAPQYDRAAMSGNRVIIAAYSLDASLPTQRTRVARIHALLPPQTVITATLHAAGTSDATRIAATVHVTEYQP